MATNQRASDWATDLADWLIHSAVGPVPAEVLHAGERQTLDSVACAFGAIGQEAELAVYQVVAGLGDGGCSLLGQMGRSSALGALLYNGTLVRTLDCNDTYFDDGPLGHPSDNLAVALAFAEHRRVSGADFLRALVVGYELDWRMQVGFRRAPEALSLWDYSSTSPVVAAAMAGLILKLNRDRLAHAVALAACRAPALAQVRAGEISMAKASIGALGAHSGALAALLAAAGMTAPAEAFEGEKGLVAAFGTYPDEDLRRALCDPIGTWHILQVATKPYPAIATSQAAIAAALDLARSGDFRAEDVAGVEVRLADNPTTRSHMRDLHRSAPTTRESADHSVPFLVAVSLEDGQFGLEQFRDERWLRPRTLDLIRKVTQVADYRLNCYSRSACPAVVTVDLRNGRRLRREVLTVPGSADLPLSGAELGEKLRRLGGALLPGASLAQVERRLLALQAEADMAEVGKVLGVGRNMPPVAGSEGGD